ncbi:hypothetical protein [Labilibaculum euxinus]
MKGLNGASLEFGLCATGFCLTKIAGKIKISSKNKISTHDLK